MRFICCILLFVVAAMAVNDKPYYNLDDAPALFEKFIIDYNRSYTDEADKAMHYEVFLKSLQEINEANAKQSSATFDINKFTDYTSEESKHLFGYKTDRIEKSTIISAVGCTLLNIRQLPILGKLGRWVGERSVLWQDMVKLLPITILVCTVSTTMGLIVFYDTSTINEVGIFFSADKVEGKSNNEGAEGLKLSHGVKESECVLGG